MPILLSFVAAHLMKRGFPLVATGALAGKARAGGRVINTVVIPATAVFADEGREVLG